MSTSFILASASPRRRELLKSMGFDFTVIPSGVDEKFLGGESVKEHVLRLSREKAQVIAGKNPEAWVLGADTVVIIDSEVLGKPGSKKEAREMLVRLSGKKHRVLTGFSVVRNDMDVVKSGLTESSVFFKEVSDDELEWYIDTKEPYDKAGGYAVQGMAASFVKEIRGSHTNVIGLPLCEVVAALKEVGAISF
ncbi:MAG: Maf family protein [Thermodesulfobacteriota bacterium]|nr:Maf family protein [Thermodesulfobacteriota bacterium]